MSQPLLPAREITNCPDIESIPDELKAREQWACFHLVPRKKGKFSKRPVNAHTGEMASVNDPSSWSTFDEAWRYYLAHRNDPRQPIRGICYMFSATDPYTGIDYDDVLENGKLRPDIQQIVESLSTYTEKSFSGTGIHIIVRAELPGSGRNHGGIEIYDSVRFFVVTGNVLDGYRDIKDRQLEVDGIRNSLPARQEHKDKKAQPVVVQSTPDGPA